jgi:hypothetical protein
MEERPTYLYLANKRPENQEISSHLWSQNFKYRIYKSSLLDPILNQMYGGQLRTFSSHKICLIFPCIYICISQMIYFLEVSRLKTSRRSCACYTFHKSRTSFYHPYFMKLLQVQWLLYLHLLSRTRYAHPVHRLYFCVSCYSHNKQQLYSQTIANLLCSGDVMCFL